MVNLHAQIDGLTARVPRAVPGASAAPVGAGESLVLIDLLMLRGHVLGRIADYEQAAELAGHVRDTTDDGTALLARARTRAVFHRFAEALADLQAAEERGMDPATVAAERAEILQATGSHAEAGELHRGAARRRPGFATLGAMAVFHAERGEAERLFAEARHRYQGTSPFPIASLFLSLVLGQQRQIPVQSVGERCKVIPPALSTAATSRSWKSSRLSAGRPLMNAPAPWLRVKRQ